MAGVFRPHCEPDQCPTTLSLCRGELSDLEKTRIKKKGSLKLGLKGKEYKMRLSTSYGEDSVNSPLAIIGSGDFLEISINQGSAAQAFNAKTRDKIIIRGT